ncbi:MAG: YezD family protein [Candidatus Acidiferrales bacterium]
MSTATSQDWQQDLSTSERELLREVALALRGIRYGSVVLTVHDGRIVELNKTGRIRKNSA